MKNILLTGSQGLLGRAIKKALSEEHRVMSLTRRAPLERLECTVVYDLCGGARGLVAAGLPLQPDLIIHLAAAVPASRSGKDSDEQAAITRAIDNTVFGLAAHWDCPVLYASGCSLYRGGFADEESPMVDSFSSPYLHAKADGDRRFLKAGHTVMRVSSPYGIGIGPKVVLHKFIASARAGLPIEVWGSGSREQDFIHIEDVARFCCLWTNALQCGAFNVAYGKPLTMAAVAKIVASAVGPGLIKFHTQPDPLEEQRASYSINKAREVFGWRPVMRAEREISSLAIILPLS